MAVYLSARCKVMFAPAMDLDMYQHPATKENIEKLKTFENILIQPGVGSLASGLSGEGRMAEPEEIAEHIKFYLSEKPLLGKKALVTSGPTYEAIDPVRFVGNHSSGKMGVAVAEELARKGAKVTLVIGPSDVKTTVPNIFRVDVQSARDMFDAASDFAYDIAVLAAAVADYTPVVKAAQKIKKNEELFSLELHKTKDILLHLGSIKKENQVLVGFAMETENEIDNAIKKASKKNADFIVLNSVNTQNEAFGSDLNTVSFVNTKGKFKAFEKKSKKEIAIDIVEEIILISQKNE